MSTQPSDDVTVTISYGNTTSSTTFTTSNWNRAKTGMITAMQDTDDDDEDIIVLLTANGGGYDSVTTAVAVRVDDDEDTAVAEEPEEPSALQYSAYSVVIDDRTWTVAEGDSTGVSYTVQLSTQPSADVTVAITGATDTDLTVSPASLTFTSTNWDTAQTVTVTAAQDTDNTDDDVILVNTATGGGYESAITRVAVRVDDDEDTAVAGEPKDPDPRGLPVFLLVPTVAFPQVAIYSNGSGNVPGSELCQVERLTGYETGLVLGTGDWPDRMYAGECAGETLAASTTYWVVFKSFEPYPQSFYRAGHANSTNHDTSSTSGWSIGDSTYYRIYTNLHSTSWNVATGRQPLAVGIYADAN